MVNASASLKHNRWLVLVCEGDLVDQNDGLSVGDGFTLVSRCICIGYRLFVQEGIRRYR